MPSIQNAIRRRYWYTKQPCTLDIIHIKWMCEQAGILWYCTNHSLRATAATKFQSGCVEEQETMKRTEHESIEAVRSYKRTYSEQLEQVSDILKNKINKKLKI